jgi:hypothetical protein
MKIATVVVGLIAADFAFIAYKSWIDINWTVMENGARLALANATTQALHTQLNSIRICNRFF